MLLRSKRAWLACLGEIIVFGVGLAIGCRWLGVKLNAVPVEDQDRLLLVLLPLTAILEFVAALLAKRPWWGRTFRIVLAILVPPLMLLGSGYLPGGEAGAPSEWTSTQAITIVLSLGAALAIAWTLLNSAAQRPGGFAVPAALAVASLATGLCMMLSANASGGFLGLAVGGTIAGIVVAALIVARMTDVSALVGLGLVGLFGLLMGGRFFSELSTTNAVLLFVAPLLCWAASVAPLRKLKPAARFCATLLVCVIPAAVAAGMAQYEFQMETPESPEYSAAGSAISDAPGDDAPLFNSKATSQARASDSAEPAPASSAGHSSAPIDPGANDPASPSGSEKRLPVPSDPGKEDK
jgi:hypothetical protein